MSLTAWLAAQWCGLVVMCNVQHLVTNHIEGQISREQWEALPSPFTGGWLHMCSFKKCLIYSLTSCQLYFLVLLSSFLAHLLTYSHIIYIQIKFNANILFTKPCVNIPPHIIKLKLHSYNKTKGLHVGALHCVVCYTAAVQTFPKSKASLQCCTE